MNEHNDHYAALARAFGKPIDKAFEKTLEEELAFALAYHERLVLQSEDAPSTDVFAPAFAMTLSIMAAARPDVPVRALSPAAIREVLHGWNAEPEAVQIYGVDPEMDEDVVQEALHLEAALHIARHPPSDADQTPTHLLAQRRDRLAEVSFSRLMSDYAYDLDNLDASDIRKVVDQCCPLSSASMDDLEADQWIATLVMTDRVPGDRAEPDPRSAVVAALVAEAVELGLDDEECELDIDTAVSEALDGMYGASDVLREYPAMTQVAAMSERPSEELARHVVTFAATMMHIGFSMSPMLTVRTVADRLWSGFADDAQMPFGSDPGRLTAALYGSLQGLSDEHPHDNELDANDDDIHPGERMFGTMAGLDVSDFNAAFTNGAISDCPREGGPVEILGIVAVSAEPAALATDRMTVMVEKAVGESRARHIVAGIHWLPADANVEWTDLVDTMAGIAREKGVDHVVAFVDRPGAEAIEVVRHAGGRATLIDVAAAYTQRPEPGRTLH